MSDELRMLKSIDEKLEKLLKWTKFAGMQELRTILTQNLRNDTEMLIYELSDGEKSTREVAELSGVGSNSTVASYWKKWSKIGIVEPSPRYQGRFQQICSLEEVGIPVPPQSQYNSKEIEQN